MKIAFISDIHEDIDYLKLAINKIERLNCDFIVCLGDIVGFSVPYYNYFDSRNANLCIELISKNAKYSVIGNHDHYAIKKTPKNTLLKNIDKNWYNLSYEERKEIATNEIWLFEDNELSALLNKSSIDWLNSLEEFLKIEADNISILVSHFIFPNITGFGKKFIKFSENFNEHIEFMINNDCQLSFFGHIHEDGLMTFKEKSNIIKLKKSEIITNGINCVGIPAIARSARYSGFAVFDTSNLKVNIHSIGNKINFL